MAKQTKAYGLKEVPLKNVVIGPYQARRREVEKDLDKLKLSIQKIGLLYPILVYEEEGKYKTIDGQRRVQVFQDLGEETIPAIIIDKPADELMAKAKSYSATQIHEPLSPKDSIDLITDLFDKYHDAKLVAEEYGITENEVREYVGIGVLKSSTPELWKWYEERRTEKGAADTVLRAAKASRRPDGSVNEEKAVELAPKIYPLLKEQQEEAVKVARERPDIKVDEIVDKAKQAPVHIATTVPYEVYERFEKRLKEDGVSRAEGARKAIDEWSAG